MGLGAAGELDYPRADLAPSPCRPPAGARPTAIDEVVAIGMGEKASADRRGELCVMQPLLDLHTSAFGRRPGGVPWRISRLAPGSTWR